MSTNQKCHLYYKTVNRVVGCVYEMYFILDFKS